MSTNTYLFAWNPVKWPWPEISEASRLLKSGSKVREEWNCVSHKKIKPCDRAFFTRVGSTPRGIFASGYISSEPFLTRSRKNKEIYNVFVNFDVLLDPDHEPILTTDLLNMSEMSKQLWTPQSSGILIKPELVWELEALWKDFLKTNNHLP